VESGPRSAALPSGWHNPMPGGVMAGYQADTGLDIAGSPRPVHAIAAGTIEYAEPGHTLWTGPSDTANCVRFALDTPIPWKGHKITHVYYAHLSQLAFTPREGETPRRHVEAGERLGVSGVANHSPHLHIGLLLDDDVSQAWGTFLLADAVRKVLGGYKNGDVLPREPDARKEVSGARSDRGGRSGSMRPD
jgi:murein DD-endopeptidase MepM/ murein hydrolase activator NlpD